jgi:hypothetical protein
MMTRMAAVIHSSIAEMLNSRAALRLDFPIQ